MDLTEMLSKQMGTLTEQVTKLVEERAKADLDARSALEAKIKSLETRIESLTELGKKAERMHLPGVEVGTKGEKNKYSYGRLGKLVLGMANKDDSEYGYEVEVAREMAKRLDGFEPEHRKAITAASGTSGAFLISTEVQNAMIPELEASSVVLSLGARTMSGLTGNIAWNRDLGGISAAYIDTESGGSLTTTQSTFGQMELSPHVYIAGVDVTWKMMNQPVEALEPWIRQRLAYKIGLLKDITAFNGTGSSSAPRGLKLTPNINTVDFAAGTNGTGAATVYTGATQTLTKQLSYMMAKLPENNANLPGAKLGWACSPYVVTALTMPVDADGRPLLWSPSMGNIQSGDGRLGTLMGKRIAETTQLSASASVTDTEDLWYGDWNNIFDANWGTLAFASSDQHNLNFTKALVTIRAIGAHDIGVYHPKAFVRGTNFEASTLA